MDVAFAWEMPGHFVGLDVGAGASLLMVAFAIVARCTGVPDGDIVSAGVTVVVVIVPLVGIGRVVLAVVGQHRRRWNADRKSVV